MKRKRLVPCAVVPSPPDDVRYIGREIIPGTWAYPFYLESHALSAVRDLPGSWLQWIPRDVLSSVEMFAPNPREVPE